VHVGVTAGQTWLYGTGTVQLAVGLCVCGREGGSAVRCLKN